MAIDWRKAAPHIARRLYYRTRNSLRVRKIYEAPDLRIDVAAGRENNAVVIFNSRRERAFGTTPHEFVGTVSDGGRRHLIFVTDPERRWFQAEGVAARIIEVVGAHLARVSARPRLCLGGSMGGYGAVVFASALGADAALALAPQWDVGPDAQENAWRVDRDRIDEFRLGSAGSHIDGRAAITVVHGERDRWHSDRFAEVPSVTAWRGPGHAHNVSKDLKEIGLLRGLVEAAAQNDSDAVSGTLEQFGARRIIAATAQTSADTPSLSGDDTHGLHGARSET